MTASIDEMNFHRPVPVGQTVLIESFAYETGRTSVKVALEAAREDPATGDRKTTTGSRFVFVAIDQNGSPVPVADLTIASGVRHSNSALEWERNSE